MSFSNSILHLWIINNIIINDHFNCSIFEERHWMNTHEKLCIVSMTSIFSGSLQHREHWLACVRKSPSWHRSDIFDEVTLLVRKVETWTKLFTSKNQSMRIGTDSSYGTYFVRWSVNAYKISLRCSKLALPAGMLWSQLTWIVLEAQYWIHNIDGNLRSFRDFWNERNTIINSVQQKRFWFKDIKKKWWLRHSFTMGMIKPFFKGNKNRFLQ